MNILHIAPSVRIGGVGSAARRAAAPARRERFRCEVLAEADPAGPGANPARPRGSGDSRPPHPAARGKSAGKPARRGRGALRGKLRRRPPAPRGVVRPLRAFGAAARGAGAHRARPPRGRPPAVPVYRAAACPPGGAGASARLHAPRGHPPRRLLRRRGALALRGRAVHHASQRGRHRAVRLFRRRPAADARGAGARGGVHGRLRRALRPAEEPALPARALRGAAAARTGRPAAARGRRRGGASPARRGRAAGDRGGGALFGAREDVPALLQAMDAFALPTRYEGFGIALLEAQAAGLPCFAPDGAVPREAAVTGLLRLLPPGLSAAGWAGEILAAKGLPRRCRAEEVEAAGCGAETAARRLEALYERCRAERGRGL